MNNLYLLGILGVDYGIQFSFRGKTSIDIQIRNVTAISFTLPI